jgi:poly-gamma-glutamate biosynthesis protein PgsC/CapC
MIVTSFALGIAFGFLFFELTGLAAGGIIVPGYIALFVNEPSRILATLAVALVAYLIVEQLARYLVVFGRRRFLLMILVAFTLRLLLEESRMILPESGFDMQAIGYIIPGLIANEFYRQGILRTTAALTVVSVLVWLVLQLIFH